MLLNPTRILNASGGGESGRCVLLLEMLETLFCGKCNILDLICAAHQKTFLVSGNRRPSLPKRRSSSASSQSQARICTIVISGGDGWVGETRFQCIGRCHCCTVWNRADNYRLEASFTTRVIDGCISFVMIHRRYRYEDFHMNAASEAAGRVDSTNHMLVWKVWLTLTSHCVAM